VNHAQGGGAVVLVRNAVDHDSRVLREARTLQALGLDTTVLGVVSFTQTRQVSERDGVTVRRIGPRSRLGWAVYREISSLRPGGGGGTSHRKLRGPGSSRAGALVAPARAAARRLLRWLSTLSYYGRAIPIVVRARPRLVHCNDYNTMWIGVAARLLAGSAVVYDSHELWADRNLRPEPRWWLVACEALFVRLADRVVTTSPAYAEELARRYRIAEPVVVRNIPEQAERGTRPGPDRAGGDGRLAVYVGGLQPGRGIEQSIRALALANGAKLRLLGPSAPAYRLELERLVGSLGLEDRVEFADPVPPERLLAALGDADVGLALIEPVCLSYRLTLPNKLFEYALAGLPVLGSDLPMIASFIDEHGLGTTVDPGDPAAVAAALTEMLEPAANERYRRAAARSAAALDWSSERDILSRTYRDALAARGRAPR
jgi:glycosyltransferase involved in cell wall biosynthesis